MEEKGFEVAGLRRRRIWVSDHRKPEEAAAVSMRMKPSAEKDVSPATIMIVPIVMVRMMPPSRQEGFSRPKAKAKTSTQPSTVDLHIARSGISRKARRRKTRYTHCRRLT